MNASTLIAVSGVAYSGVLTWLVVRAINRRERSAILSLVGLVAVPLAYLLLLGPCCWLSSRTGLGAGFVTTAYRPVFRVFEGDDIFSPTPMQRVLSWYGGLIAADGWTWESVQQVPMKVEGVDFAFRLVEEWNWMPPRTVLWDSAEDVQGGPRARPYQPQWGTSMMWRAIPSQMLRLAERLCAEFGAVRAEALPDPAAGGKEYLYLRFGPSELLLMRREDQVGFAAPVIFRLTPSCNLPTIAL